MAQRDPAERRRVFPAMGVQIGPAASSISIGTTLPNRPVGTFGQAALANTHAFPVVAGARTYALNVTRIDLGTATIKADGTLTALYIPFGYNGGPTLAP